MSYVGDRKVLDADSHVMELPEFLDDFIDPEYGDRLDAGAAGSWGRVIDDARARARARRTVKAEAELAETRLLEDKGWRAGAGPARRRRAAGLCHLRRIEVRR
jgi:hypothetical protein